METVRQQKEGVFEWIEKLKCGRISAKHAARRPSISATDEKTEQTQLYNDPLRRAVVPEIELLQSFNC